MNEVREGMEEDAIKRPLSVAHCDAVGAQDRGAVADKEDKRDDRKTELFHEKLIENLRG